MSTWTATAPTDRLPGFTFDRAVEIATYTHIPVRDLLTAGRLLSASEPLYTREDALRYVATSLAAQQSIPHDLPFDPIPVIAWLHAAAAAVAQAAAGDLATPRQATVSDSTVDSTNVTTDDTTGDSTEVVTVGVDN